MVMAEAGERRPQARGHLEPPSCKRQEGSSPQTLGQGPAPLIEILGFQAPEGERPGLAGASHPSWGHEYGRPWTVMREPFAVAQKRPGP